MPFLFSFKPFQTIPSYINKHWLSFILLTLFACMIGNAYAEEPRPPSRDYTNRIIVKFYSQKNTLIVEDHFLQWSYDQGIPLVYIKTLGTGANVYRLSRYNSPEELEHIIDLVLTNDYIEYAEPDWIMIPVYSEANSSAQQIKLKKQLHLAQRFNRSMTVALLSQGYPQQSPSPTLLTGLQINHQPEVGYCSTPAHYHNMVATAFASLLLNASDDIHTQKNQLIKLLPVKLGSACKILTSELVEGIIWASGMPLTSYPKNQHPAQAIVLPIALQGCSRQLQWAIDIANSTGSVVIAAQSEADSNQPTPLLSSCRGIVPIELFAY